MKYFKKKYEVLSYFLLALAISWSGVIAVVGMKNLVVSGPSADQMPLLFVSMCAGPSLAALILTVVFEGKEGLRFLTSRLLKWNLNWRWYAIALFTAPVLTLVILLLFSIFNTAFLPAIYSEPNKAFLLMSGILGGVAAGIFEELGWSGFAIPRLRKKISIIKSGIIVGVLWGLWHLPLFLSGDPSGESPRFVYLAVILFTHLPAYRVLMVWLYDKTQSLLLAVLMHMSLTICALTLAPVAGVQTIIYTITFAIILWIISIAIIRNSKKSHLKN